jgi:peptidoglycan-N-acetylglucosamine deacetylase
VLAQLQPGEIVLMHVGSNPKDHSTLDGDSLKTVIEQIKAAGYGFTTIPHGLGLL